MSKNNLSHLEIRQVLIFNASLFTLPMVFVLDLLLERLHLGFFFFFLRCLCVAVWVFTFPRLCLDLTSFFFFFNSLAWVCFGLLVGFSLLLGYFFYACWFILDFISIKFFMNLKNVNDIVKGD